MPKRNFLKLCLNITCSKILFSCATQNLPTSSSAEVTYRHIFAFSKCVLKTHFLVQRILSWTGLWSVKEIIPLYPLACAFRYRGIRHELCDCFCKPWATSTFFCALSSCTVYTFDALPYCSDSGLASTTGQESQDYGSNIKLSLIHI